jgi:plasmid maintenance system antidote protein VapI
MPMHSPPHIGDFIRTERLDADCLTVTSGAVALGVTRQTIFDFA